MYFDDKFISNNTRFYIEIEYDKFISNNNRFYIEIEYAKKNNGRRSENQTLNSPPWEEVFR